MNNKNRLLIIEIVFSVAILAISLGICGQLYLASYKTAHSSEVKIAGMNEIQSAINVIQKVGFENAADYFGGIKTENTITAEYDKEWKQIEAGDGMYSLQIEKNGDEYSLIVFSSDKEIIINQNVYIHSALKAGESYE